MRSSLVRRQQSFVSVTSTRKFSDKPAAAEGDEMVEDSSNKMDADAYRKFNHELGTFA